MDVTSDRTYPSKRDRWLVVVIWAALLASSLGTLLALASPGAPLAVKIVSVTVTFASMALAVWVLYSTRYTLTADRLIIRSGPFRWRIDLASIEEIRPSRNPLSSPACSLDRLEIRYRRGSLMISPEDKPGFLRDLTARFPVLAVEGERVVRRPPGSSPRAMQLGDS